MYRRGGSRTLYFVLADVDVRRGLDDVAGEVVDHGHGFVQSCLFVGGSNVLCQWID